MIDEIEEKLVPNRHDTFWHTLSVSEVAIELKTSIDIGFKASEVALRLKEYGPNQLLKIDRPHVIFLLLNQFKNSFIIILMAAAAISGFLGHVVESVAIGIIIFFTAIFGFIQEWRAERALEALQEMSTPLALVLRDGVEKEIPAKELVPGDIIVLSTGDRVPADARLIESMNLKIEESPLTGESVPVEKKASMICPERAVVGDRKNMVFAGTAVTYGRGRAIVVATGMYTEFGHIAGLLQGIKRETTPLQKSLNHFAKVLTNAALIIVLVVILLGLFRGQPFLEVLIFGIALAVAVVPEALPAVVTISLAIGVQRMAKRHALVRYLPAVEMLGCATVICTDKTGTLTKDEMTVRKIYLHSGIVLDVTGSGYDPKGDFLLNGAKYQVDDSLINLLQAATLSSDARLMNSGGAWDLVGDPTEAALVVAAAKAGINKELLDEQFPRMAEVPFSSETKRMTTLHQTPKGTVAYGKGAAEVMLAACTHFQTGKGEAQPLTEEMRNSILATTHLFAEEALRVIGVAYIPATDLAAAQKDMIFLGLLAMIDPPRAEAEAAIASCFKAGIQVMMITGDHPITATAIARELGLLLPNGKVLTGLEISAMTSSELEKDIESISVCARVSPEHKLRIIEALQKKGHVVAMTGDGINDAPALKKSDIGIAMGITGTDVTKEAATMTLTDDNFSSIVAAIEEGRVIFANIKKFLAYLISSNLGEIGLIVVASLLGLPLPLTAVQILYINLISDGLPALALAVDPPDHDIMTKKPRKSNEGLLNRSLVVLMIAGASWSVFVNTTLFIWSINSGRPIAEAMTMVFASLVLIQFVMTYNFRSGMLSFFYRPFANRWLNWAILSEVFLLIPIIYLPIFQIPFNTVPLSQTDWIVVLGVAITPIPVLELVKFIIRRRARRTQTV
ncbi:MAG: ATPase [Candidatus Magasanikbacteria bacterium RIFOXYD1_FULL_40_23]|uniref:ATPase n=1 Tax=Candidatus Magasanikbacteria bacterium RIFOXYD1_FULL_40_23 TaxID=1798705 RepID=A0A1F6P7S3_9BACT|nr:MAG: ATPase [Candidatus Magasanikbacteria bacterium RIFOXYD1_FULL_40_23]